MSFISFRKQYKNLIETEHSRKKWKMTLYNIIRIGIMCSERSMAAMKWVNFKDIEKRQVLPFGERLMRSLLPIYLHSMVLTASRQAQL